MAKLKSLDIKICLTAKYSSNPLKVIHQSREIPLKKGTNFVAVCITELTQKIKFEFRGFVPNDKEQSVRCDIVYKDKTVDTHSLSAFQMTDNKYVDNKKINSYIDTRFNGTLELNFFKQWFESNILNGTSISAEKYPFVHSVQDYKIIEEHLEPAAIYCVGCSWTTKSWCESGYDWPSLLAKSVGRKVSNLGVNGLGADGCFRNVQYVLKNFKDVEKIVCLLPGKYRRLFQFEFLGYTGYAGILGNDGSYIDKLPPEFKEEAGQVFRETLDEEKSKKLWISSCNQIIEACKENDVECLISTWEDAGDLYDAIPQDVRLPHFPKLDIFNQRGSDGVHPHGLHNEYFVKQIKPYFSRQNSK
jgi:hypothetical protein